MTATSVSGVGPGSADGDNKGSQHMTLGVDHLIGPRVVATGLATLASGSPSLATVTFPQALDSSFSYTALITAVAAGVSVAPTGTFAVATFSVNSFQIVGSNTTQTRDVYWVVNKV